jgi:hypothetical protein
LRRVLHVPSITARTPAFATTRSVRVATIGNILRARPALAPGLILLRRRLRTLRRATRFARRMRRVGLGVLRRAALLVAGVRLIGGRRRILVRRSGTFGYIRHGGAL